MIGYGGGQDDEGDGDGALHTRQRQGRLHPIVDPPPALALVGFVFSSSPGSLSLWKKDFRLQVLDFLFRFLFVAIHHVCADYF